MRITTATLVLLLYGFLSISAQGFDRCIDRQIFESLPKEVKKATIKSRDLITREAQIGSASSAQFCDPFVRRIPVVFHVIHNGGTDSISLSQIQTQMTVLNEDFRKVATTPGDGSGVDTRIDFFLARRDPSGSATTGVTYTNDSIANFTYSATNDTLLKGKILWPQQRYLNIWVVDTIMFGPSYLLGYAYQPSNGANSLDGVVVADQHIGRSSGTANHGPYRYGRTLTHEIGHYLGLWHPFDYVTSPCEGDSAANCATQGDFVCDVPPHSGPYYGCPTHGPLNNSCTEFPKDTNDYVNNYMEYVNDTCMDMFSQGQAARMFAAIDADSFRQILTSTENLNWFSGAGAEYHGVPDPYYIPFPQGNGCVGDSFFFRDYTLGFGPYLTPLLDSKWSWKFFGASPDTSDIQNPTTVWYTPGLKTIMLTASNSYGICMRPFNIVVGGTDITVMNDTVTDGDSAAFFTSAVEPGTWSWNFGDGSGDSASTNSFPKHLYPGLGSYQYTATFTPDDTNQCVSVFRDTAVVLENLPVTYQYFTGKPFRDVQVILQWATEQELDASHFEVERSEDGYDFEMIGRKNANGNSHGKNSYEFVDYSPLRNSNFYRLRQVDKNGAFAFSRVVEVSIMGNESVRLFPNPASSLVKVQVENWPMKEMKLVLTDLQGRKLIWKKVLTSSLEVELDLSELETGLYLMQLQSENDGKILWSEKLFKLK